VPQVTIRDGDFGAGGLATFSGEELLLPDPARPGLKMLVPMAEIAEINSIDADPADRLKNAAKLGARGFVLAGPIGVARGLFAATKVHEVVFKVVLEDGRHFVAAAEAKIFAELHSAQIAARFAKFAGAIPTAADDLIAKYVETRAPEGESVAPEAPPPVTPQPVEPRRGQDSTRPVFGRRGR
jgi:hypothetical protein